MPREYKVYFRDILEAVRKIERYTENLSFEEFMEDELIQDGVVRNLEIVGEAVKHIPEDIKKSYPGTEWRKIAGLRDFLIHVYFGVDLGVVWDVVKNKIPELKEKVEKVISDIHSGELK